MNSLLQRLRKPVVTHAGWAIALVCFSFSTPGIHANPRGGEIIHGEVMIEGDGRNLEILQDSDRAIIEWDSFSIGEGEATRVLQPGSTAALLNRVVGGSRSDLNGLLEANGKVFLINPSGVLVGPNGRVDTAGFVASTLDLSDADFLDGGDMLFSGPSAAAIVNLGTISASESDIILIAANVSNAGSISAPEGTAGLAAGTEVLLQESGEERLFVRQSAGGGVGIDNAGEIEAGVAELKAGNSVYSLAVRNSGRVRANGVEFSGGKILLKANGGKIENTGSLEAASPRAPAQPAIVEVDAGPQGDVVMGVTSTLNATQVRIQSDGGKIAQLGSIVAGSGDAGIGEVTIDAGIAGDVELAVGSRTAGEQIRIASQGGVIRHDALIEAADAEGFGGSIEIDAGVGGEIRTSLFSRVEAGEIAFSAPEGLIRQGGRLVGRVDENTPGNVSLDARDGEILMQVGSLVEAGNVSLTASGGRIEHSGIIVAEDFEGNGGTVILDASPGGVVDITAAGYIQGGEVSVLADGGGEISHAGTIIGDDGQGGGSVTLSADGGAIDILPTGFIQGATVNVSADGGSISHQGIILARNADGEAGTATLDAGADGSVSVLGRIDASGDVGNGGQVTISGGTIDIGASARILADGQTGGGDVRIGGGFGGADSSITNAQQVTVAEGAMISASALESGAGGTIAVWADGATAFAGDLNASGIDAGGIAEVSGRETLEFTGNVNLGSANGSFGSLLLDPSDFIIDNTNVGSITAALATANVTITTDATDMSGNGDIFVNEAIGLTGGTGVLSLLAHRHLMVNESIQLDGTGSVNLIAGWDGVTGFSVAPVPGIETPSTVPNMPDFPATANSFGNGMGSVFIGDGTQANDVFVGSRSGNTAVLGYDVNILGAAGADAGLGFQSATAEPVIDGQIAIDAVNNVYVTGANAGAGSATVGHSSSTADLEGSVTVTAGQSVLVQSGNNVGSEARIGSVGGGTVPVTQDIQISSTNGEVLLAGNVAAASIGHLSSSPNDLAGDITISADQVSLDGTNGSAVIGHAGISGNREGSIDITSNGALNLFGAGGNWTIGNRTGAGTVSNSNVSIQLQSLNDALPLDATGVDLNSMDLVQGLITDNLAGGDVSILTTSFLQVNEEISSATGNNLSLVSEDSILVQSSIQNAGSGDLLLLAGWDGVTPPSFTPGAGEFGLTGGVDIGTGGQTSDIFVGSRGGSTGVFGSTVSIDAGVDASAGIGFVNGASGNAVNGDIKVVSTGGISLTGADNTTGSSASIGHKSSGGSIGGSIMTEAGSFLSLQGGDLAGADAYIGSEADGSSSVNQPVDLTVGTDLSVTSGLVGTAGIGHMAGGSNSLDGDVTIKVGGDSVLDASASDALIGHRGANGNRSGAIDFRTTGELDLIDGAGLWKIGHQTAASVTGDLFVGASSLDRSEATNETAVNLDADFVQRLITDQIGNGNVGIAALAGPSVGQLNVNAPILLNGSNDLGLFAQEQITISESVIQDGSGNVRVIAGWSGSDVPTTLPAAVGEFGQNANGHVIIGDGTQTGDLLVGSRDGITQVLGYDVILNGAPNFGIGIGFDAGANAGSVTGDITVGTVNDLELLSATGGTDGTAWIGHQGDFANLSGNINVQGDDVTLDATGADARIGHLGVDGQVMGDVDVFANGELSVVDGTGSWTLGNRATGLGTVSGSDFTVITNSLQRAPGAPLLTIDLDADFTQRLIRDNIDAGKVSIFGRNLTTALTVSDALNLNGTEDLVLGGWQDVVINQSIQQSGSGAVTVVGGWNNDPDTPLSTMAGGEVTIGNGGQGQPVYVGSRNGNTTVLGDNVSLNGALGQGAGIGYFVGAAATPITGDINVEAQTDVSLNAGPGSMAMIGHKDSSSAIQGRIDVTAGGDVDLLAVIGTGGIANIGSIADGTASADQTITISAGDEVNVVSGMSGAEANIGHRALSDNDLAGDIDLTSNSLVLDATNADVQVGHQGVDGDRSGTIGLDVTGELDLVTGTGDWTIGHTTGATGVIDSGDLSVGAGSLDNSTSTTATDINLNGAALVQGLIGNNIENGSVTIISGTNLNVDTSIFVDGPNAVNLLAEGDVNVNRSIQIDGTGDLTILSGWDGSTLPTETQTGGTTFGLGGGNVNVSAVPTDSVVRVGSRSGTTSVLGNDINLTASNFGDVQVGFRSSSGEGPTPDDVTGDILVSATGDINFSGGSSAAPQIGHRSDAANISGAISVLADGDVNVVSGQDVSAMIGSSGADQVDQTITIEAGNRVNLEGSSSGGVFIGSTGSDTVRGDIKVVGTDVLLNSAQGDGVSIGHSAPTTTEGKISVKASGELDLIDGANQWSIGHSNPSVGNSDVEIIAGSLDDSTLTTASAVDLDTNLVQRLIGDNIGSGRVTIGALGSDLTVDAPIEFNSDFGIDLLAGGDVNVNRDVQITGDGGVTVGAGWDGVTDLSQQSPSGSFGLGTGSVQIGDGSQGDLFVGSNSGATQVFGHDVNINGAPDSRTFIGFNGESTTLSALDGSISVMATNDVNLFGADGLGAVWSAMIGHSDDDTNITGDIEVFAGGDVLVDGGVTNGTAMIGSAAQGNNSIDQIINVVAGVNVVVQDLAMIGHKGFGTNDLDGNIQVVGANIILDATNQDVMIGHAGPDGDRTGHISLFTAGELDLVDGLSNTWSIGHSTGTGNIDSDLLIQAGSLDTVLGTNATGIDINSSRLVQGLIGQHVPNGNVTIASIGDPLAGSGDLTLSETFVSSFLNDLNLIARGDLTIDAPLANTESVGGGINLVAGWDGRAGISSVLADVEDDYVAAMHMDGMTSTDIGIPDTIGIGNWEYGSVSAGSGGGSIIDLLTFSDADQTYLFDPFYSLFPGISKVQFDAGEGTGFTDTDRLVVLPDAVNDAVFRWNTGDGFTGDVTLDVELSDIGTLGSDATLNVFKDGALIGSAAIDPDTMTASVNVETGINPFSTVDFVVGAAGDSTSDQTSIRISAQQNGSTLDTTLLQSATDGFGQNSGTIALNSTVDANTVNIFGNQVNVDQDVNATSGMTSVFLGDSNGGTVTLNAGLGGNAGIIGSVGDDTVGVNVLPTTDLDYTSNGGADTLDYFNLINPVSVDLSNDTADGFTTASGFQRFIASGIGGGSVDGPDTDTNYTIDGVNQFFLAERNGAYDPLDVEFDFSGFENVTGGDGDNTFFITDGGSIASLDGASGGGEGGNTGNVSYALHSGPVEVNLETMAATGITQFTDIFGFTGSANQDRIIGAAGDNIFTISGDNQGVVQTPSDFFGFDSFESLEGMDGDDEFNFVNQATVGGLVDGGMGADTLFINDVNLLADANYVIEDGLITRNPTYAFVDIETIRIVSGEGNDTFNTSGLPFLQDLNGSIGDDELIVTLALGQTAGVTPGQVAVSGGSGATIFNLIETVTIISPTVPEVPGTTDPEPVVLVDNTGGGPGPQIPVIVIEDGEEPIIVAQLDQAGSQLQQEVGSGQEMNNDSEDSPDVGEPQEEEEEGAVGGSGGQTEGADDGDGIEIDPETGAALMSSGNAQTSPPPPEILNLLDEMLEQGELDFGSTGLNVQ